MSNSADAVIDLYHGTPVSDAYRWLESDSTGIPSWLQTQQALCQEYFLRPDVLAKTSQFEPAVRNYLARDVISGPIVVRGSQYFYERQSPTAQQASIVMRDGLDGAEEVLVDPCKHDTTGLTSVSLIDVSSGCKWLAYGLHTGGSRRQAVHILDLEARTLHPWSLPEGFLRSFRFEMDYTARYIHENPADTRPHLRREIRQRLLGDEHYEKINYVAGESKDLRFVSYYSEDMMLGVYRMMRLGTSKRETIMLLNRRDCGAPMALVADDVEFNTQFQIAAGMVYVCTNYGAPNKRLCRLDLACPTFDAARTLVPETNESIQWWAVAGDRIFVTYVRGLVNATDIFDLAGTRIGCVHYPGPGTADLISRDDSSGEVFVSYESYHQPPTLLRITGEGTCIPFLSTEIAPAKADAGFNVERRIALAKDGTEIPYTLLSHNEHHAKGVLPAVLTGYGGSGVSLTPRFSSFAHVWTETGGIFVIANLRGGTEFGAAWHEAAKGAGRTIAFEDFRAVAEDLFARGTTTPEQLGIAGGSNSGLLVAHAMTEWPGRMRAVLCLAPLTDLLRFRLQKPEYAIELGSVDDPEQFQFLVRNSPFHRVQHAAHYPALLMVTGARDDTCAPYHALKFVAAAQDSNLSDHPVLLDFDPMRGHAARLSLQTRIAALSRRLAFMGCELDHPNSFQKGGDSR